MSSSRLLVLALLLALLCAGLVALWFSLASDGAAPISTPGAAAPAAGASGDRTPAAELQAPEREAERPGRDALSAGALATRQREIDPETARWLEGRVHFPAGSPVDESLEVVALGDNLQQVESGKSVRLALKRGSREQDRREVYSRAQVAPDGSFRLAFPGDVEVARVDVDGRFLFLQESVRVDPAEWPGEISIEPELGGCLRGSFLMPTGAPAVERVEILAIGWSLKNDSGGNTTRALTLEDSLDFELRGLRAGLRYFLVADPGTLAPVRQSRLAVEPGEITSAEITLELGARLSGRVVDDTGRPVGSASLRRRAGGMWGGLGDLGERAATTAEDGTFTLSALPSGPSTLEIEHAEYIDGTEDLELAEGEERHGLEIVLARGGTISGVVVMPDGDPAEGASVAVDLVDGANLGNWSDIVEHGQRRITTTDATGAFTLSGLAPGSYAIVARLDVDEPGAEPQEEPPSDEKRRRRRAPPWQARAEDVDANSSNLRLVLEAPHRFSGRVVDDTGAPLESFRIRAARQVGEEPPDSHRFLSRFDDAGGVFEAGGVYPGRWSVVATAIGHVDSLPVVTAIPQQGGELLLVLPRAATIRGTVVDATGSPVEGAQVEVDLTDTLPAQEGETHSDRTDDEGGYELEGLPAGSLVLQATSDEHAESEPVQVEVELGQLLEGVDLRLGRGGSLTGEVFDAEGRPSIGRQIQVQSMDGGRQRTATSDGGGRFALENITPGTYQVVAVPSEEMIERMMEDDQPDMGEILASLRMSSVEIVEGETVHVVLGAPPRAPVRVHGRVTRDGQPMTDAMVMVLGEDRSLLESLKMAQTGEDGRYEITLDEPGYYTFVVQRDAVGGDSGSQFDVEVPEQDEWKRDLEVPRCEIHGTVYGPAGRPLGGVQVSLTREDELSPLATMFGDAGRSTDPEGRYVFEDLHAGRYAVSAGGAEAMRGSDTGRTIRDGVLLREDQVLEGVDLHLPHPGEISGVVRDATGRPLAGAHVWVRDAAGRILSPFTRIESDRAGRYIYRGVSPGDVTVSARSGGLAAGDGSTVHVVEGSRTEVDLVLEPATILRLRLEDEQGEALRARVRVLDSNGFEVSGMSSQTAMEALMLGGISTTEHRVGPLPPGRYEVRATTSDGRAASKPVVLSGRPERRMRLRLKE